MPWDTLWIMRLFRQDRSRPAQNVWANDIFDMIQNAGGGCDIVEPAQARLITVDAVATCGAHIRHQAIDICAHAPDFSRVATRSDTLQLTASLDVARFASSMGSRLFVQPSRLLHTPSVPSETEQRLHPIRFAHPYLDTDEVTLQLPEGYGIEVLPEPVVLDTEFGRFETRADLSDDGALRFRRTLEISARELPASAYDDVRAFFAAVERAGTEQVVLRKER